MKIKSVAAAACGRVAVRLRPSRRGQGSGLGRGQRSSPRTVPQFEKSSGNKVRSPGPAQTTSRRKSRPARCSISSSSPVPSSIPSPRTARSSPAARSIWSVERRLAVKAGRAKPDLKSGDDLKKTLLAAKSVCYSAGPSGVYHGAFVREDGHRRPDQGQGESDPARRADCYPDPERRNRGSLQQVSELIH